MGVSPRGSPTDTHITNRAIARIISGIKKGVRIAPYDKAWPRNFYFVNAFAAKKASIVAIKLETTPT